MGFLNNEGLIRVKKHIQGLLNKKADKTNEFDGFEGGKDAIATANGAIQLGTGINSTENSLQVYDKQLLTADGYIPKERMVLHTQIFTDYINTSSTETSQRRHTIYYDIPQDSIVIAKSIPLIDGSNAAPVMTAIVQNSGRESSYVYVSAIPGSSLTSNTYYQVQVQIIGC